MYDLTQLKLSDVTEIGVKLRRSGKDADCLETVAQRCVRSLYETLTDPSTGEPACALARFFKTQAYGELPADLKAQAGKLVEQQDLLLPDVKCLTLLATQGCQAEWCDRRASQGHQAIPLTSEKAVDQIPMISQLIESFGLDINSVLAPDPNLLVELERKTCNVFFIPAALGSEYIPAQADFVAPFGVKSVLGFGGMLPSGELFAIILFLKVEVPAATAHLFRTLPLNIKMAMVPFLKKSLFQSLQVA